MQEIDHTDEQERCLNLSVKELDKVNKQLAKLNVKREELIDIIIGSLSHNHKGQKSYEYGEYKIEVKTPNIYSLNTSLYKSGSVKLPDLYNPIKESISYSVDKILCDQYLQDAPDDVIESLALLIDEKPGKKNVVLSRRIKWVIPYWL